MEALACFQAALDTAEFQHILGLRSELFMLDLNPCLYFPKEIVILAQQQNAVLVQQHILVVPFQRSGSHCPEVNEAYSGAIVT